jgi:hypothetical protein
VLGCLRSWGAMTFFSFVLRAVVVVVEIGVLCCCYWFSWGSFAAAA